MDVNATPAFDKSDNPTGCCPRFNPEGWDDQELHFVDKPFVRASTLSLFHVPLNMGSVFAKTWAAIERDKAEFIAKEEARVKTEELAEVARITAARALALVYLGAAGSAFVFFMLMALYLIFAKIEDNLATINRTIQSRTLPAAA